MLAPPTVRIPGPAVAPMPPKPGFPIVAATAPLVVAGVLFAVTGSPFMLLMAVFGPVLAVATLLDGRRQRRRAIRDAQVRFAEHLADAADRARSAIEAERRRLQAFAAADPAWASAEFPPAIAVGRGDAPSGVEIVGAEGPDEPPELTALRHEAAIVARAPLVRVLDRGARIAGPPALAAAAARTLALRIAARSSPESMTCEVPAGEEWARRLPHAVTVGAANRYRFDVGDRHTVVAWGVDAPDGLTMLDADACDATTRASAAQLADRLRIAAQNANLRPAGSELPERADLADVLVKSRRRSGLSAPIGVGGAGPIEVDLIADGPHAVVAGTTGSGKSELLVAWVLGMAAGRSPGEVSFVLVDFKGGAAFAPLVGLPHVLGTFSDLDAALARRAIESLRAEVRRREQVLADAGVRAIDDLPAGDLARLVVIVDEFAALVSESPELHALFADLAARGRSLGVHLVLCTQRPSGVVRDAVLANVAIRIALRVADRADSLALLGDDAAARLPPHPRGRAVVVDGAGRRAIVQVAIAAPADVERIADAAPTGSQVRPWCDPLPDVVAHDDLPETDGIPFGLLDLPAEQRQPAAALEPRHGHLLVLGAGGAGVTTALEAVAAGAAERARWLPGDAVGLWSAIADPSAIPDGALLLADDLDLTLARCPVDHAPELADLLARLLRDGPARGIRLVVGARRLAGPVHGLAPLFGSRLLLRQGSREDHVLAGAPGETYDPRARPGAATWEGAVAQVARPTPRPRGSVPGVAPVRVEVPERGEIAVVAARPHELAGHWNPARVRVRWVGEPEAGAVAVEPGCTVWLGDPDAWHADWALLARARRDLPFVFVGCAVADVRTLARVRETPPLLGPGEAWLVSGGRVRRAVIAD